jgi:hypothetical protein
LADAAPDEPSEAEALCEAGRAATADGRHEQALARFRQAYELEHDAEILFELGQAAESSGRLGEARRAYAEYLRALPAGIHRSDVEARVAALGTSGPSVAGPTPDEDSVRVETDGEDLVLMARVSRSTLTLRNDVRSVRVDLHEYADICTLPCDAPLSALGGVLGVSHDDGDPVPAGHVRGVLNEGDVLRVHFDDRSGLRVAGWITAIGGAVLGAVLAIVGLSTATPDALGVPQYPWELIGAGTGILVVGLAVGFPLAFLGDAASVEIE